jgi:hypothetical protein
MGLSQSNCEKKCRELPFEKIVEIYAEKLAEQSQVSDALAATEQLTEGERAELEKELSELDGGGIDQYKLKYLKYKAKYLNYTNEKKVIPA